jgi:putative DNA-binding protein
VVAPHQSGRRKPAPADRFILPSRTLRPEQRVRIYVDAYLARLIEALEEDFPAVARVVGRRTFHALCRAYLERYPSRSYSLNPLGRRLPEILADRPRARDLARVEVAMSEVFDAEQAAPLKPSDFGTLTPEKLARARLSFVPAFRLLELDTAANPTIDAVRQDRETLPPLKRKRSWMAVYRKDFQVWRLDLEEPAFSALLSLHRGRPVSQAVAAAARVWTGRPEALQSQIRRWFGEWVSEGFFARVA